MIKKPSAAVLREKMRRDTELTIKVIKPSMTETKNIKDLADAIRSEIQSVKLLQTNKNKK